MVLRNTDIRSSASSIFCSNWAVSICDNGSYSSVCVSAAWSRYLSFTFLCLIKLSTEL